MKNKKLKNIVLMVLPITIGYIASVPVQESLYITDWNESYRKLFIVLSMIWIGTRLVIPAIDREDDRRDKAKEDRK